MNQPVTIDQTAVTPDQMLLNAEDPAERKMLIAERTFHLQQREANVYAQSDVVPNQFKGKIANCIIAQDMANRLGVGVIEVMQNIYVVHGSPAFASKYKIARVNNSGKIKGQLKFKFFGEPNTDGWGCYAHATSVDTGEEIKGPEITIKLAKDEGWYKKPGSKWPTMPEKMLMYRAGSWFADVNMPETTFGFPSVDDAEDAGPRSERDITPLSESNLNETFKPKLVGKQQDEAVDAETGEVEEETPPQAESQEAATSEPEPAQQSLVDNHSPAFQTLAQQIARAKAQADAVEIFNLPSVKKLNQKEFDELQTLLENRKKELGQ